jgi:hypothetical protein
LLPHTFIQSATLNLDFLVCVQLLDSMSLSDFLRPFAALPKTDLVRVLTMAGYEEEEGDSDDLLRTVSAELLAIGVEDLLQRASDGTRAALGAQSAEELETRVKKDLVGFLEGLPPALVRQFASEAGIQGEEAEAEQLRVRLFEETVLLGAEGLLALQDDAMLRTLLGLAGAAVPAAGGGNSSLVEALMVRLFNLRDREPAAKKARPAFASKSEVAKLKVAELRALCQERGLATDGLKGDLVDRVWGAQK